MQTSSVEGGVAAFVCELPIMAIRKPRGLTREIVETSDGPPAPCTI